MSHQPDEHWRYQSPDRNTDRVIGLKTTTGTRELIAEWAKILAGVDGVTDSLVAHLAAVAVDHQNGIFRSETDVVERIGGQPAETLTTFIRKHRSLFGAGKALAS